MPSRDEQQAPLPPLIPGLDVGALDDSPKVEASVVEEPSRAEQSQSSPRANQLPGQPYYEVATPCLMGLIVDGLIPPPSPEALEWVAYRQGEHQSVVAYKMLISTAITVLEQVKDADGVFGAYGAGVVIDQLKDAGFRGAQVLLVDYPRRNPHPPAASLRIVRRPNGALGFA